MDFFTGFRGGGGGASGGLLILGLRISLWLINIFYKRGKGTVVIWAHLAIIIDSVSILPLTCSIHGHVYTSRFNIQHFARDPFTIQNGKPC